LGEEQPFQLCAEGCDDDALYGCGISLPLIIREVEHGIEIDISNKVMQFPDFCIGGDFVNVLQRFDKCFMGGVISSHLPTIQGDLD